WDGAYVLVPTALTEAHGRAVLEAFGAVAAERPELDLVVLADAVPELSVRARALGIHPRVHFAGDTPREAEHTWLASASAVVLPGGGALAAGLVARAVGSGVPLVAGPGTPESLGAWLERRTGLGRGPLVPALEAALGRGADVRAASERGRAFGAAQQPDAF